MQRYSIFMLILLLLSLGCSCALFGGGKDVATLTLHNEETATFKILIASRSTAFKEEILQQLIASFTDTDTYVKVIGLSNLSSIKAMQYDTIILMNMCVAGNLERPVRQFLQNRPNIKNTILLTTSGDGHWLPELDTSHIDAISSASRIADAPQIIQQIQQKIASFQEKPTH